MHISVHKRAYISGQVLIFPDYPLPVVCLSMQITWWKEVTVDLSNGDCL